MLKTSFLTILLAFAFMLQALPGQVVAQSTASEQTAPTSRLPLRPCRAPGLNEEVLCGTYEVYEDNDRKSGRRIPLNIVVLPALATKPAPDPLFVLVGGPGQAATEGAAGDAQRFAAIRRERDIVLVDQRGAGRSNRLNCDLGTPDEIVQAVVAGNFSTEKLKQCREQLEKQADLRLYSTPIAMDDLDEVRAWLGSPQINLYGGSYGTVAALTYLQRHPKRVRTVTLRAVYSLNPVHFAPHTQQSLDHLLSDCGQDEACAKAYPNLRANLQTVLDRLAKTPIQMQMNHPRTKAALTITITRDVFAGGIRRMLYDANTQRFIPLLIQQAHQGNFQLFENVVNQTFNVLDSVSLGMNFSVGCAEGVNKTSAEEIAREAKGRFLGENAAQGLLAACRQWPQGKLPGDYFLPVRSDVPVLMLSGELDPASPSVLAEQVAKTLPNSRHVVMKGIAHAPFPPCALTLMAEFVVAGNAKELDVSCAAGLRRPAFALPSAAR
jgi:pimeloyl-ACP methyl ester carboxylesterase